MVGSNECIDLGGTRCIFYVVRFFPPALFLLLSPLQYILRFSAPPMALFGAYALWHRSIVHADTGGEDAR